jgi:hypothetical protein
MNEGKRYGTRLDSIVSHTILLFDAEGSCGSEGQNECAWQQR